MKMVKLRCIIVVLGGGVIAAAVAAGAVDATSSVPNISPTAEGTFTICLDSPLKTTPKLRIRPDQRRAVLANSNSNTTFGDARCTVSGLITDFSALGVNVSSSSTIWYQNGIPIPTTGALNGLSIANEPISSKDEYIFRTVLSWPPVITSAISGNYSCRIGSDEAVFEVHVAVPAQITYFTPSLNVTGNSTIALRCIAIGDVPLKLTLYKNGVIGRTEVGSVLNWVVPRPPRDNNDQYSCVASNIFANSTRIMTVTVFDPPSFNGSSTRPTLVQDSTTTSSVYFTLQPPARSGNLPILQYTVNCTPTSAYTFALSSVAVAAGPALTVGDLHAGARYSCVYQAMNMVGWSEPSSPVTILLMDSLSAPPSIRSARAETASSIYLSFESPSVDSTHGDIKSYRLTYTASCSSPGKCPCAGYKCSLRGTMPVSATGTSVVVRGLRYFTSYTLNLHAVNRAGVGHPATDLVETLEHYPGPVQRLTLKALSTSAITVTWEPPSEPNGIVKFYRLWYRPTNFPAARPNEFDTNAHSYVAVGLTENTEYSFTISAMNSVGIGEDVRGTASTESEARLDGSPSRGDIIETGPAHKAFIGIVTSALVLLLL